MTNIKQTGNRGEHIAQEYLEKSGYKIIARNYRWERLELDIITLKNNHLIFFEIKTRFQNKEDGAAIPLAARQVKNLKRAIINYCLKKRASAEEARLDLIVITVNRTTRLAELKHYKNIF
jgi:putative endonuclease